jgi:hypothetical protein
MAVSEQIKEYLNNLNLCKQINHLASLGDNKIRQYAVGLENFCDCPGLKGEKV